MRLLGVAFIGGLTTLGLLLGHRWYQARVWRKSLVAYRLRLPHGLSAQTVSMWLDMVAAATRRQPIVVEIVGTSKAISFYLLVPRQCQQMILAQLRTAMPVRAEEDAAVLASRPVVRAATELRLTSLRPLAHGRAEATVASLLSALSSPFARGEVVRLQWILRGAAASLPQVSDEQELRRAHRAKQSESGALLSVVGRIAVSAPTKGRAVNLLGRVTAAFGVLNAPGVSVVRRWLPVSLVTGRLYRRAWPLVSPWPLLLNTKEAVAIGLPVGELHIPGLTLGTCRQLPAPPSLSKRGVVVGVSNYAGQESRPLALRAADRLRHLHVIGPTGVGKSTLLANMALQDITMGYGVIVVDPKGDLAEDILARLPDERVGDVIAWDGSAMDYPLGFNLLQSGTDEHSRELVVDQVVHILAELWRSSWGPRTADVVRNCLLTLTHVVGADGCPLTIVETAELLTNAGFRRFVLRQPTVPASVRGFWSDYEQRSEADRVQIIGPSIHRLRSLTTRSALRLALGQSSGLDLMEVFTGRKVLLCSLAKGRLGSPTAHLLGSLLVAWLWQTVLRRAAVPAARRRPVFAYLDEFADVIRLSGTDLADMLAQARGLGLGLVLAHQTLDQLPRQVRAATLGTVRSQVIFQLDADDARVLEPRVKPALAAADLQGLDAHEIVLRPCVDGVTLAPVTGCTLPLPAPVRDPGDLARQSRAQYGVARDEVEAALAARRAVNGQSGRLGRTRRESAS